MVVATATVMGLMIVGRALPIVARRGSFALVIPQTDFRRFGSMHCLRQRRRDEGQREERGQHEAQIGKDRFDTHTEFLTEIDCQNMRQV